jgi:hypothetical protein
MLAALSSALPFVLGGGAALLLAVDTVRVWREPSDRES